MPYRKQLGEARVKHDVCAGLFIGIYGIGCGQRHGLSIGKGPGRDLNRDLGVGLSMDRVSGIDRL